MRVWQIESPPAMSNKVMAERSYRHRNIACPVHCGEHRAQTPIAGFVRACAHTRVCIRPPPLTFGALANDGQYSTATLLTGAPRFRCTAAGPKTTAALSPGNERELRLSRG